MQEEPSGRFGRVRAGVQGNHSWIPSHNHVHQIPGTQAWQGSTLPSQREVKDSQQGYLSHSKGLQEQPPFQGVMSVPSIPAVEESLHPGILAASNINNHRHRRDQGYTGESTSGQQHHP